MRVRPAGLRAVLSKRRGQPRRLFYSTSPAKLAESRLTSVALYTSRRPKRETILPLRFIQAFDRPGDNADRGKVGKRHQEYRERMPSPRGSCWRQSFRSSIIATNLVSDQFGGHDAAGV